jgi:hypothetical protein
MTSDRSLRRTTDRGRENRGRAVARILTALVVAAMLAATAARTGAIAQAQTPAAAASLPAKLSDAEFWSLTSDISEPGGYFRIADNFTSNEAEVGRLFTSLRERKLSGGVYLGVGPEQNYTYISAIKPAMAFIIDIRRQAAIQHLMFKAMFELSKDRADFIALLFARPKPKDLDPAAPIDKIWEAFFAVGKDDAFASKTRDRVIELLTKTHKFALNTDELGQLDWVLSAFVQYGPGITTNGTMANGRGGAGANRTTFADLTGWEVDNAGYVQSFLSTDENFQVVKALHDKNLIVPVTGDFGGAKALRGIASYITSHGGKVTAFYLSNVEQYLFQDNKATSFYENVALLPITDASVFIRPYALRRGGNALCGIGVFLKNLQAGKVFDNNSATDCAF